jgi:hypothetical protein
MAVPETTLALGPGQELQVAWDGDTLEINGIPIGPLRASRRQQPLEEVRELYGSAWFVSDYLSRYPGSEDLHLREAVRVYHAFQDSLFNLAVDLYNRRRESEGPLAAAISCQQQLEKNPYVVCAVPIYPDGHPELCRSLQVTYAGGWIDVQFFLDRPEKPTKLRSRVEIVSSSIVEPIVRALDERDSLAIVIYNGAVSFRPSRAMLAKQSAGYSK